MTPDNRPGSDRQISRRAFLRTATAVAVGGSLVATFGAENVSPVSAAPTENPGSVSQFLNTCVTRFKMRIHARAERPDQDIVGTRVRVKNPTTGHSVVYEADRQQDHRGDKAYVENVFDTETLERSSIIHGEPTGTRICEDQPICVPTSGANFRSVPTTDLVLTEEDKFGNPVTGVVSTVKADCPPNKECEKWVSWAVEGQPKLPTLTPTPTFEPTPQPTSKPIEAPVQQPR